MMVDMLTKGGKTTMQTAKIGLFAVPTLGKKLAVNFSYKIDCTHLRDPIGQPLFKALSGRDAEVQAFMLADPRLNPILHAVRMIAAEKDSWTPIAFYDPHGRYISAAVAELAGKELEALGYSWAISHAWVTG